jgi:L-fuconolactonase
LCTSEGAVQHRKLNMRIDAHQHFWRYHAAEYDWIDDSMSRLRRDFLPGDLEAELRQTGFDSSIAVQARQSLEETHWLLQLAADSPRIAGVVGWVDLRSPDARRQLENLRRETKLVGVRHVVQSEPDDRFMLQPEFLRGIAMLEGFGLTYDILIYPRHLGVAAEFVQRFPRQRFVLDHLAKPLIKKGIVEPWKADLRELAKWPNVFCKLSGMVTEADWASWKAKDFGPYLEAAFEYFGPQRLMIGSDWPVCTVAGSYSTVMNIVMEYLSKYPEEVADAVLGSNAQRFWGLATGS